MRGQLNKPVIQIELIALPLLHVNLVFLALKFSFNSHQHLRFALVYFFSLASFLFKLLLLGNLDLLLPLLPIPGYLFVENLLLGFDEALVIYHFQGLLVFLVF